jgi:DNA-binding transcriptional ArsR family regulator
MLAEVTRLFAVLSEQNRLRMLKLIEKEDTYGAEVAAALGLSYSTACSHLNAMSDAGLLERRKAGRRVFYRLARGGTTAVKLARSACSWLEDDATVKNDIRMLAKAKTDVYGRKM